MTQSLNAFTNCSLSSHQVHFILPNLCQPSQCQCPPSWKIHCSHKIQLFFQHALGAIDGSHVPCTPPPTKCAMYCNHNSFLSQNCLFACSFNLKFVFGYTGWEGSAMDNQVWEAALECRLNILGSHYFLADAGYADDPDFYSHIVASNTTLLSGIEQVKSMSLFNQWNSILTISTGHETSRNCLTSSMPQPETLSNAYSVYWSASSIFSGWCQNTTCPFKCEFQLH